jgi:hypothetical protein
VAQPTPAPQSATASPSAVAQPATTSWEKLARKATFDNWQQVYSTWGEYTISKDNWEWIKIGQALGCRLPPKVGHGSRKKGDAQGHVDNAVAYYVDFVQKSRERKQYPKKTRKQLYDELVI